MAQISGSVSDKIYPLKVFLGLNENPDGDTKLKMGEASVCQNWKITRDGNLQRRPGLRVIEALDPGETHTVVGLWVGYVMGNLEMLAACNGKVYEIYHGATGEFVKTELGNVDTSGRVHMFGFSEKVYIMDGQKYREWDGTTYQEVVGYVPLVSNGIGPDGTAEAGGELLEQINKLTLKRRAWLSPDGTNKVFSLPEKDMNTIDYVKNTSDGTSVTGWTADAVNGTVTFTNAPSAGTNTLEVGWTMKAAASLRSQVEAMRFSEIFSGATDNRVFIYGDGSNDLFYSGMDYLGQARADYFPDMNQIAVGAENTPVTGLIRHYSRLIVYKLDSTWTVSQSSLTLADGTVTTSYYCVPVNRAIGNLAPGQVHLVLNNPRTLFGDDLYEWRSNNAYSGNLTADERQAKRISDRIHGSLRQLNLPQCTCWDDNDNQEYYISYNGSALVHNYAVDAWYFYNNFDAFSMANLNGDLYIGTTTGRVMKLDTTAMDDDGEWVPPEYDDSTPPVLVTPGYYERQAIDAYWESGSISFNAEYNRKYSSALWVSVKPQTSSYVEITAFTDRKHQNTVKTIATGTGGFADWDFSSFDFADFDMAQVKKLRIKAKKFTYYKLVFESNKVGSVATVLSANMRVRETGYVK